MRPTLAFLLILLLPAATAARTLDLPVHRAGDGVGSPSYAGDRLELRLAPGAARAALPRAAGPTRARGSLRLGVAAVDAVAASLGGCTFEPEFVGETPPENPDDPDFTAFWLVHLPPGAVLEDALDRFASAAGVELALPVATLRMSALPNDSLFANNVWLYRNSVPRHDIQAPEAWNVEDGDTSIVIAIVDTGVLPYHPDLGGTGPGYGNFWINWPEATGLPGVDDDNNGFVDDWRGWDFVVSTTSTPFDGEDGLDADNDPNDFAGHGTAVAGLIGALIDNTIGLAGVVPKVRLMPLRVAWQPDGYGQPTGDVSMPYAAQAIRYATRMGASVINASFASLNLAGSGLDVAVTAATHAGVVIANASGNGGSPAYLGQREDVIAVAATDSNDVVWPLSVRGPWVDLVAQGTDIVTTFVNRTGSDSLGLRVPGYRAGLIGTSFAAPQAAGVLALLQAQRLAQGREPLSPQGLLARLRETADDIRAYNPGLTNYGTGRLNAYRALTDHPTTTAERGLAQTVGAPLVLRENTGVTRVVYAFSNQRLVAFDGVSADTAWIATLPAVPVGNPAAAAFGDGGGPHLFIGSTTGSVMGYDENGTPLPGWPVTGLGTSMAGGVAIGDLDGDGVPEIVGSGTNGRVWAWHVNGALLAGFPFDPFSPGAVPVALADLDGQPGLEIVVAGGDGNVHAVRSDGNEVANWPWAGAPGVRAAVVAHFAGAGATPTVLVPSGSTLNALAPDASTRWAVSFPTALQGDLALGDFDGDGLDEIVALAGATISVLDSNGVAIAARSPKVVPAAPAGVPVVGPLLAGRGACIGVRLPGGFYAWDDSGNAVPAFPKPGLAGLLPALADLDGDGATEVAAGAGSTDSVVYAFDAGEGTWNETTAWWPAVRGGNARTGAREYPIGLPLYDRIRPAPVTDLIARALGTTSARVSWTETGDDSLTGQAARAELRYAPFALDAANFTTGTAVPAPAPGPPGWIDSVPVGGLGEGQVYWFAVRLFDAAGNAGAVSNVDTVLTLGQGPATIADLRVVAAHDSTVKLGWTASGEDGLTGRPASYQVAGSTAALDSAGFDGAPLLVQQLATADAGAPESLTVTGLTRGRRWTFAVRAVDHTGTRSAPSNFVSVVLRTGGAIDGRGGVAIAARPVPGVAPITLDWEGSADAIGSAQHLDVLDLGGRLVRRVPLGGEPGGSWAWDGRDAEGRSVPAGLYFARLASGGRHAEARIVLIR